MDKYLIKVACYNIGLQFAFWIALIIVYGIMSVLGVKVNRIDIIQTQGYMSIGVLLFSLLVGLLPDDF